MARNFWWIAVTALALAPWATASRAEAQSLDACSNIYVEAGAECTVIPPQANCEVMCEPISVQAACAAELKVMCDASCQVQAEVSCSASCSADCEAECTVDPGEFDCQAYCQADCAGSCEASCGAGEGNARCKASCQATCSGDCNASCKIRPPQADCRASCQASCQGSCDAKANIDCQADCQADGFIDCEARVTGGCQADCMTQEGALFCDGYYVDSGDNLQMCVDALKNALDVEVMYEASAEGMCSNGMCTSTANASASCGALPGAEGGVAGALPLIGVLTFALRRRRRG